MTYANGVMTYFNIVFLQCLEEKESLKFELVPDKDETTVHVPPGPCSNAPQDQAQIK